MIALVIGSIVVVAVAGCCGAVLLLQRRNAARSAEVPASRHTERVIVLAPPAVPVTGGTVTIPEYLKRYHPKGESALMAAVTEFYRRAAEVPEVADYFLGADMDKLPRHFHAALVTLTTHGLTATAAGRLRRAHATVVNSYGEGITPRIFAAVLGVLVDVLADAGLPDEALAGVNLLAPQLEEIVCGTGPLQ